MFTKKRAFWIKTVNQSFVNCVNVKVNKQAKQTIKNIVLKTKRNKTTFFHSY